MSFGVFRWYRAGDLLHDTGRTQATVGLAGN